MSPRRSSRARTTQPPPAAPTHTNSSASSTSLTRTSRDARANNRVQSPSRSSKQRSESQDGGDSTEPRAPRRSRRGTDIEKELIPKEGDEEEETEEPENEVTRCICEMPEYPGPPTWIRERLQPDEALSDDFGNFFVQCDNCQVWQHGGCMGLTDESMLPDQYYCEQCKPESHKVIKDVNGSKSSRYLPVLEISSSRSSSLSASEPSKERQGKRQRSDASLSHAKRRATMNSRTALDDDELLRQAIEESREMGTLGKRSRDESEDTRQLVKRQRTHSSSASTPPKRSRSPSQGVSDNERPGTNGSNNPKRIRGAAARNQREKELREKQKDRELAATQRAEAARKREARSERRRGEDSPPPTPSLSPSKAATLSAKQNTDTPPPPRSNINNLRNSHKAGAGRGLARRGRLGRNQYTRDLPLNGDVSDTPGREDSHGEGSPNGGGVNGNINGESGRSSKVKTHGARTSMNEMKRRVAAILEFVGRMQGEGQTTQGGPSRSSDASGSTPNGNPSATLPTASLVQAVEKAMGDVRDGDAEGGLLRRVEGEKGFTEMGSGEMMEMLTRELLSWQNVYGRYGEKG